MTPIFAFGLGWPEIMGILVIVLVLFGAKKVPELMKGLGTGIKEFKKATREVTDEIHNASEDTTPPARKLPPTGATAQSDSPSSNAPKA